MSTHKRGRDELKGNFVKNAIPTEENFADLIHAGFNQKDDGLQKPADGPLKIEAAGEAQNRQKTFQLYSDLKEPEPAWELELNPWENPNDPESANPGFHLADGSGSSRLFIQRSDGRMGLGTLRPESSLHIAQGTDAKLHQGGYLTLGSIDGHNMVFDRDEIQARNNNKVSALHLQADGGELRIHSNKEETVQVAVTSEGRVGIGKSAPHAPLHVMGGDEATLGAGGSMVVGPIAADNLVFDGNKLQARKHKEASILHIQPEGGELRLHGRRDLAEQMVLTSEGRLGIGVYAPHAPLQVKGGHDVGLDSGGTLMIGGMGADNLVFDGHQIQARNSKAISALDLQYQGGDLHFHRGLSSDHHFKFLTNGQFFGAVQGQGGRQLRMATGATTPGEGWKNDGDHSIKIEVDTSSAGFSSVPTYFTSLQGKKWHWDLTGATSVYFPSKSGFTVYLRRDSGLQVSQAEGQEWYITWLAVGI